MTLTLKADVTILGDCEEMGEDTEKNLTGEMTS